LAQSLVEVRLEIISLFLIAQVVASREKVLDPMLVLIEGLLQIAAQTSFGRDFTVARMVIVPLEWFQVLTRAFVVRYVKPNMRRLLLALCHFLPVKSLDSPPDERLSVDSVAEDLMVALFIDRFLLPFYC
jgi:hypothetical protein